MKEQSSRKCNETQERKECREAGAGPLSCNAEGETKEDLREGN